ncbi:hypothetical protein C1645_768058 [Glomus cerebriforme]|uniref:Protein kinase domain-containing protein n=1 Tax=Glomus cerebriforme TaxID=658196 RepID=A0A397T1Q3_9GLOM|nr:hypothetical protein C1645_768058 [Glomus cerebriforme]
MTEEMEEIIFNNSSSVENIHPINKYDYIFEQKVGFFKTLDYDLGLDERKINFKKYDYILCEDCNQKIESSSLLCYNCYNKEPHWNERNRMKYGICKLCFKSNVSQFDCCKIFRTSDYYLDLWERKTKYRVYKHILCEKCNQEIDQEIDEYNYYCKGCYNKETDTNKKNYMKYGSNFKIFKTSDYYLNFGERKAKYEMKYRLKFGIFKTSDYDLDFEERKAKYRGYNCILCENCNQEIDNIYCCYCKYCYNKETSEDARNLIKYGKCKICAKVKNNFGECCSTYEFKRFLENFDKWISKNKVTDNYNDIFKEPKVGISDYDLDENDRLVKYKDYDYILCEKRCNKRFSYYYCFDCYEKKAKEIKELLSKLQDYENFYSKLYDKETKKLKELKELQSILKDYENVYFNLDHKLGIFKQIIQQLENIKNQIESKKILVKNIRYGGIHECDLKFRSYCNCYDKETDSSEKKRMKFGKCKECFKINENLDDDCLLCKPKHFENDFVNWTSGNETIDKSIQENQLPVRTHGLLEWIPYDKFTNIKYIAEGGFAKVYSAMWIDGRIKKWSQLSNSWRREGPITIALKVLKNSENISEDFLNEVNKKENLKMKVSFILQLLFNFYYLCL